VCFEMPIEINITGTPLPSDKLPIFFLKPNLTTRVWRSRHACLYHDWLIERSLHAGKDWNWLSSLASNFRTEVAFQLYSVQW
jgi:hypothetical protein